MRVMAADTEYPVLFLPVAAEWESWLEANHAVVPGAWLHLAKKAAAVSTVSYAEAVDLALCFGWIDGQAKRFDAQTYIQKFTPRRRRSVWSRINREKALALIDAGRMRPAGLAAIDSARADGRWEAAYDSAATAVVPEDLKRALAAKPAASAFFDGLTGANRYAILYRIQTAVRPETRARRIARFVEMLERGETLH